MKTSVTALMWACSFDVLRGVTVPAKYLKAFWEIIPSQPCPKSIAAHRIFFGSFILPSVNMIDSHKYFTLNSTARADITSVSSEYTILVALSRLLRFLDSLWAFLPTIILRFYALSEFRVILVSTSYINTSLTVHLLFMLPVVFSSVFSNALWIFVFGFFRSGCLTLFANIPVTSFPAFDYTEVS